jgi:superfamily II DNA helicase RecQ
LTQVGKLFQTAGPQAPRKLEEALTEAFTTTQDNRSSFWALKELKEFRLVTKEKWQEWNKLVRSRFKEEDLEEEEKARPVLTMGETIEMLRSVRKGSTQEQRLQHQRKDKRRDRRVQRQRPEHRMMVTIRWPPEVKRKQVTMGAELVASEV